MRVATVDVTATKPDMNQVGGAIAFQPMYSDTGALAFTQADSSAPTGYTCLFTLCPDRGKAI